jgi:hypothetical protein
MLPDRDASWNARLVKVTTWELTMRTEVKR